MARSGWAALVVTVLLVAGLGSEPALDAVVDADRQAAPLLQSLTAFPAWSASGLGFDSDMYAAIGAKIVVLLLLVFLLARAAGHVGASFAAFLAGWGTLMIAAAVAGVVYVLVADMVVLDGQLADAEGGAGAVVVDGLNRGAVFGLYTGWLIGVAVVFTARPGGAQAAGGWRASPPSRTLPVPPAGGVAAAATPEAMADMNLVPGMPSVSAPAAEVDPWAPPVAAGPETSAPAWTHTPQPQQPADGAWPPQLQATADAAAAGPGPAPWTPPPLEPEPGPSTEGQPFVPPGTWPRPVGVTGGVPPTAESPVVPSSNWAPMAGAGAGVETSAGASGPVVPSGSWPPSALEQPPTNGGGVAPSYEQPEYSGMAPSRPTGGVPDPSAPGPAAPPTPASTPSPGPGPAAQVPVDDPALDADTGEFARPLWPSSWPATSSGASGGAYADRPDAYSTDQVKRLSPDETAENGARTARRGADAADDPPAGAEPDGDAGTGDQPDGANTRFW